MALLRTYLGKAYFEEARNELAGQQYAAAKELDPLDPTPYLYDAIRKQTENRPVEALADLERSIALNDNRAVYRSRLLLDEDRAARGTSLARIYDDLGFLELGANEAARSLAFDPTNASTHRFLSDIYGGLRRRESARMSELLQAQLLQNININPVQPSLAEANLNIVTQGGPAEPGFNELTPLFERDRAQLTAAGLVGSDETLGGEAVASALWGRYSISGGAFHYTTDGWRPNHDIEHSIYQRVDEAGLQLWGSGSMLTASIAASVPVATTRMTSAVPSAVTRASRYAEPPARNSRGVPAPTRRRMTRPRL
jgi:tetratricopeptide (TPR) repeat protein